MPPSPSLEAGRHRWRQTKGAAAVAERQPLKPQPDRRAVATFPDGRTYSFGPDGAIRALHKRRTRNAKEA